MVTLLGVFLFLLAAGGLVWLVEAQIWRDSDLPAAARPTLTANLKPARRPRCLLHRNRWAVWLPLPLPFFTRRLAVLIVIKF
jgi:hypothetical protein